MTSADLCFTPALELARLIRRRALSPVELTRAVLERIARLNGSLNATRSTTRGQPAISVPAGWTASGLPVGLQIVGRRLEDALVLRAAATFEALRPWAARRPSDAPVAPGAR